MSIFLISLTAGAVLLLTAVPGYLFIKCKVVGGKHFRVFKGTAFRLLTLPFDLRLFVD